jgi:hypothetical protein
MKNVFAVIRRPIITEGIGPKKKGPSVLRWMFTLSEVKDAIEDFR